MVEEGAQTSFAKVVAQIAREEGSCALWLRAAGVEHEVIFRNGMPVYATPQSGVNDLVTILQNAKQLDEARAMSILASLPASPILWEQNLSFFDSVISRGELYGVLESAVRMRLLALFGVAPDAIERREVASTSNVPLFRIEPARLILDGVATHTSDDALLRVCPIDADAVVRVRFDAISRYSDLTLNLTEMDRLSRVDGKRLAALREVGFPDVGAVHRFVCALALLNIVEIGPASESAGAKTNEQPAANSGARVPGAVEEPSDGGSIEEIGVVYGGGDEYTPAPQTTANDPFRLAPEGSSAPVGAPVAPQRPTLTARVSKPAVATLPASQPVQSMPAKTAGSAPLVAAKPPAVAPIAAPKDKPARRLSPLFQKFPQVADKDFFMLLGVGRQFQPFEVRSGLTTALKPLNVNRFELIYKGTDADLAMQLIEHLATAYVVLQDPKYKALYIAHLDEKKDELFRLTDTLGKAAVDATIGDILMKNKLYARAETYFVRAGDAAPKLPEYQFNIAKNLYLWSVEQGKELPARIKGALDNAIALNTHYYDAYLFLGYYYKQTGKNELALRKFKEAVEVNPKGHEAASEIRLLSMRTKEVKKKSTFFGLSLGKKSDKDK